MCVSLPFLADVNTAVPFVAAQLGARRGRGADGAAAGTLRCRFLASPLPLFWPLRCLFLASPLLFLGFPLPFLGLSTACPWPLGDFHCLTMNVHRLSQEALEAAMQTRCEQLSARSQSEAAAATAKLEEAVATHDAAAAAHEAAIGVLSEGHSVAMSESRREREAASASFAVADAAAVAEVAALQERCVELEAKAAAAAEAAAAAAAAAAGADARVAGVKENADTIVAKARERAAAAAAETAAVEARCRELELHGLPGAAAAAAAGAKPPAGNGAALPFSVFPWPSTAFWLLFFDHPLHFQSRLTAEVDKAKLKEMRGKLIQTKKLMAAAKSSAKAALQVGCFPPGCYMLPWLIILAPFKTPPAPHPGRRPVLSLPVISLICPPATALPLPSFHCISPERAFSLNFHCL